MGYLQKKQRNNMFRNQATTCLTDGLYDFVLSKCDHENGISSVLRELVHKAQNDELKRSQE